MAMSYGCPQCYKETAPAGFFPTPARGDWRPDTGPTGGMVRLTSFG